ncbi:MAG: hypothetical protein V9H69_24170 [Anaerolineae bacterium]
MTDRRATLRPRLKHLEAESINWPADFWRDPSAWQALGVLLEAGGPGAIARGGLSWRRPVTTPA